MSDCPICLEVFNCAEQAPILLFGVPPCGHSCCMACVKKLAAKDGHLTCPVCRSEVVVPSGGVGVMPKNFSLMVNVCLCVCVERSSTYMLLHTQLRVVYVYVCYVCDMCVVCVCVRA